MLSTMVSRSATLCLALAIAGLAPLEAGTVELTPVAEGVWMIRRDYVGSNAAVIVDRSGLVIVDTHVTPAAARDTLAAIREISDLPIRYIVNTHWHTDHTAGNSAYLAAAPGIPMISHDTVPEDLQRFGPEQMQVSVGFVERALERAKLALAESTEAAEEDGVRRFVDEQQAELDSLVHLDLALPNLTLSRRLTLHGHDLEIVLLYLGRGHTRGDIVAWIPSRKVLVAGDLLTAPSLYIGQHSRPSEWLEVLDQLEALAFDRVVPGHGELLRGKTHLRLVTRVLRQTVDAVRSALDEGLDYADLAARLTPEYIAAALAEHGSNLAIDLDSLGPMIEDAVGTTYLELTGRLDD